MAGKIIYTGDMIAALENKIDDMMLKLDAQTTALSNINSGVAQSVTALNVEASEDPRAALAADIVITTSTEVDSRNIIKKMRMFCNGAIRIKATVKMILSGATAAKTISVYYSKDKGVTWAALATSPQWSASGTYTALLSGDFAVSSGDEVWLAFSSNAEAAAIVSVSCLAGDLVFYGMKDIVNDGAFAFL